MLEGWIEAGIHISARGVDADYQVFAFVVLEKFAQGGGVQFAARQAVRFGVAFGIVKEIVGQADRLLHATSLAQALESKVYQEHRSAHVFTRE